MTVKIYRFTKISWSELRWLKNGVKICHVLKIGFNTVTGLCWLSYHSFPLLTVVGYPGWPIHADLLWLTCTGSSLARLSRPDCFDLVTCPGWPIPTALFLRSCSCCPSLAVLSPLIRPSCPVPAVQPWPFLSQLSCPGRPVLAILSPAVLSCPSCLVFFS